MFEVIAHTADIRIRVTSPSLEDLFRDAVKGLMSVMRPQGDRGSRRSLSVHVDSPDTTSLLIDFLNDVLTRCAIEREKVRSFAIGKLAETSIDATIDLHGVDHFEEDVKAVTYHEAEVRRTDHGWTTMLVFDI